MNLSALQNNSRIDVANIPLESLAANKQVPQAQKIQAASQAFEALLLRQILEETQRPAFASKLVGNSTTDSIYRGMVVNQLAESISKSGTLGLAKSLSTELQPHTAAPPGQTPAVGLHQSLLRPLKLAAPAASAHTKTNPHD